MTIKHDYRTANRDYPLPDPENDMRDDVVRIAAALRAIDSDMGLRAVLLSPAFQGTPTAPTAVPGTDSAQIATCAYVIAALAAYVGGAPDALNSFKELADALGNDPHFATSLVTALGGKQPLHANLTAVAAGGAPSATGLSVLSTASWAALKAAMGITTSDVGGLATALAGLQANIDAANAAIVTANQNIALASAQLAAGVPSLDSFRSLSQWVSKVNGKAIGLANGFNDDFMGPDGIDWARSSGIYVDPSSGTLVGGVGAAATVLESKPSYPQMVSNTQNALGDNGYVASASSEYDGRYQAYMAYDRNYSSGQNASWNNAATGVPCWNQLKFPTVQLFAGYAINMGGLSQYLASDWQIIGYASTADTVGTVIDTRNGQLLTPGRNVFLIPAANRAPFIAYRINVTGGGTSSQIQIPELEWLNLAPLCEAQTSLPGFTSNTQVVGGATGHLAFASSTLGTDAVNYQPFLPFRANHDGVGNAANKYWQNNSPYSLPQFVGRILPQPTKIGAYAVTGYWDGTYQYTPIAYQLQVSNDTTTGTDGTWTTIDQQNHQSLPVGARMRNLIHPAKQGLYKAYRLLITVVQTNSTAGVAIVSLLDLCQVISGVEAVTSLPVMTGNAAPAGSAMTQVNGQSNASYDAWKAMSGNYSPLTDTAINSGAASYGFAGNGSGAAPWSFTRQFSGPVRAVAYALTVGTAYVPTTFRIDASIDGQNFTTIDSRNTTPTGNGVFWDAPPQSPAAVSYRKVFLLSAPATYQFFRFVGLTSNNVPVICDFQILQGTSGLMDFRSVSRKAPKGVPSSATMWAAIKKTAGSALNVNGDGTGNLTISISRNGSDGTFKPFVMAPAYPAGDFMIYTAPALDLSTLPVGNDMVVRGQSNDSTLGAAFDSWMPLYG